MLSPLMTVVLPPVASKVAEFIFTRSVFNEYVKFLPAWSTVKFSPAIKDTLSSLPTLAFSFVPV